MFCLGQNVVFSPLPGLAAEAALSPASFPSLGIVTEAGVGTLTGDMTWGQALTWARTRLRPFDVEVFPVAVLYKTDTAEMGIGLHKGRLLFFPSVPPAGPSRGRSSSPPTISCVEVGDSPYWTLLSPLPLQDIASLGRTLVHAPHLFTQRLETMMSLQCFVHDRLELSSLDLRLMGSPSWDIQPVVRTLALRALASGAVSEASRVHGLTREIGTLYLLGATLGQISRGSSGPCKTRLVVQLALTDPATGTRSLAYLPFETPIFGFLFAYGRLPDWPETLALISGG